MLLLLRQQSGGAGLVYIIVDHLREFTFMFHVMQSSNKSNYVDWFVENFTITNLCIFTFGNVILLKTQGHEICAHAVGEFM